MLAELILNLPDYPIMRFRPCIDLHQGKVKQIVGGTLQDSGPGPRENFVAEHDAAWFARKFRADELVGGHLIMLGPGNELAAKSALAAWPEGLQVGGGINQANAAEWLAAGASQVIVTSWLFDEGQRYSAERTQHLAAEIGRERLVIDLSCRRSGSGWTVTTNRWQTLTDTDLSHQTLDLFAPYCSEFLIHAADVEGLCGGIDEELVALLGEWDGVPITYAGGARSMADIELVQVLGRGKVDVTIGSALDLFGGTGVAYDDAVAWNRR